MFQVDMVLFLPGVQLTELMCGASILREVVSHIQILLLCYTQLTYLHVKLLCVQGSQIKHSELNYSQIS